MSEQLLILPKLKDQLIDLQSQLKESFIQHKKDIYMSYREVRTKKKAELQRLTFRSPIKQLYQSQQKVQGQLIDQNKDIYLCNEPMLSDYKRANVMAPARVTEKGTRGIQTCSVELPDGRCFGPIPKNKMSQKEMQYQEYWDQQLKEQAKIRYKALLDSQTGITKKQNQHKRLKEMKIFVPNKFVPRCFDEHPSYILSLTESHKHNHPKVWIPNRYSGGVFEDSFVEITQVQQQPQEKQQLRRDSNDVV